MSLSQVLVPGESWELVASGLGFADAPAADDRGSFYYSDMRNEQGLYRVSSNGTVTPFLRGATGISGMKFGPDGRLYACRIGKGELVAIDVATSQMTVLTQDFRPNDLVVTRRGHVYFTDTDKKAVVFVDPKTKTVRVADEGISGPNGIALSPDQGTLLVSDYRGTHVWIFRIETDGRLGFKQPYATLRTRPDPEGKLSFGVLPAFQASCRADGMITDTTGRYFVATELGVQMFDPTGRLSGVIPGPQSIKGMTSVAFAGPNLEFLYATCFDKIYRLKTRTRGVLYFQDLPKAPGK